MTYKDAMRIFTGIMERIVEHFPHQFALEMGINGINDILSLLDYEIKRKGINVIKNALQKKTALI